MLSSPSSDDLWFDNSHPRHRHGHQQHSNIWTLSSLQLFQFFQRGIYPITFSDNKFAQSSREDRNLYLRFTHTQEETTTHTQCVRTRRPLLSFLFFFVHRTMHSSRQSNSSMTGLCDGTCRVRPTVLRSSISLYGHFQTRSSRPWQDV